MRTTDTLKTNVAVDIKGFNSRHSDDVIINWSKKDDDRFPGYGYYVSASLPWYHGGEWTVVEEYLDPLQALRSAIIMQKEIEYYEENHTS